VYSADPTSVVPNKVDILPGGHVYLSMVLDEIWRGSSVVPIAIHTQPWWVLSGKLKQQTSTLSATSFTWPYEDARMHKFLKTEEVTRARSLFLKEKEACEQHFHITQSTG